MVFLRVSNDLRFIPNNNVHMKSEEIIKLHYAIKIHTHARTFFLSFSLRDFSIEIKVLLDQNSDNSVILSDRDPP